MKFINFMNNLLTNFDSPKNSKLEKISSFKFMFKEPYISQYLIVSTNESSKFTLDCVEAKKVYILLTDVINFKLRLINFGNQKV